MIKVNLLRNRGGGASTHTISTQATENNTVQQSVDINNGPVNRKDIAVKIVLVLIWCAVLITYEKINIDSLSNTLQDAKKQNEQLVKTISETKATAEKAKELQKNKQDLEHRIKAIKDLSKTRLREIKAIDYIQNVIPEKLWLSSIEFKDEKLSLMGASMSDDQLNKFLDSLESKTYFKNVILLKAVEQKTKEGTIKSFEISSSLSAAE